MNEHVRKFVSADAPWSKEDFEAQIRAIGPVRYHDLHPFHKMLHGGKLNKGQVAAWALNRYCYQEAVPRKDAAFMSRTHDRELRREWIHRIHDHDGLLPEEQGGLERWLKLTDCLGLDRDYVQSMEGALPATRYACEAYVRFVVEQPLVVAAASSLTELFAPSIHREPKPADLPGVRMCARRRNRRCGRRRSAGRRRRRSPLRVGRCGTARTGRRWPRLVPGKRRCT